MSKDTKQNIDNIIHDAVCLQASCNTFSKSANDVVKNIRSVKNRIDGISDFDKCKLKTISIVKQEKVEKLGNVLGGNIDQCANKSILEKHISQIQGLNSLLTMFSANLDDIIVVANEIQKTLSNEECG